MLANVTAALQRFRRRLRLRAFTAGTTIAATWLGAGGAAALVAMHVTDRGVPVWLTSSWLGPVALLVGVLVVALLWGWWLAARTSVGYAELCEHLEQRLGTGSLLLVAGEGVTLPEPFDRQLAAQLQQVPAALPPVGLAARVQRPALALLLLAGATLLPAPVLQNGGGAAATAAVGKLEQRVEALAADPRVPDDVREDLQAAVQDLERRVGLGEDNLWREIDQLTERVDREVAGLAPGAAAGAPGAGPDAAGAMGGAMAGAGVGAAELLEQARQLSAADRLLQQGGRSPEAGGGLSTQTRELLDAARDEHGDVDASRLAADPRLLPQVAERVAAELAASLQAAAAAEGAPPGFAEQAAQLAAELASGAMPQSPAAALSDQQLQALMQSVAEGASALAGLGESLDGLAGLLQDALGSSAAELAEQALQRFDVQQLMKLLPSDPQQLQALARRLAELARAAAQSQSQLPESSASSASAASSAGAGEAGANGMSAAQRAQLQQLAERLAGAAGAARAGGRSGGAAPGDGAAAQGSGAAATGESGESDGRGAPGRGPGHAALRMTEHAAGEVNGELELPTPVDPGQLSREWRPTGVQKAAPEVGAPHEVAPGGDAAPGGGGVSTWQLRLMPRHRAAVQRFFGGGDSASPANGGARGGDKK